MKGLLIKDFYTIVKQYKFFLILLILFFIPDISVMGFGVFFCALLPMTSMAYDEQAKWDSLAAMMPYSLNDIVLSKYLIGYCCMGAFTVLSSAVTVIVAAIKGTPVFESVNVVIIFICIGLIFLAISMPLMFKMGVEKGRMLFIFLSLGVTAVVALLSNVNVELGVVSVNLFLGIIVVAAIVLNFASIALSKVAYRSKIS